MKAFVIIKLLLLTVVCSVYGQSTLEKFIIQHAKFNRRDTTSSFKKQDTYLSLLKSSSSDSLIFKVNHGKDRVGFEGRMFDLRAKLYAKTAKSHKAAFITFRWDYTSGNASEKETAFVQIWRIEKPKGMTFECWILFRNGDLLEMDGIVEGTEVDAVRQYRLTPEMITAIDYYSPG